MAVGVTSNSPDGVPCPWAAAASRWPDELACVTTSGKQLTWSDLDDRIHFVQQTLASRKAPVLGYVVDNTERDIFVVVAALREGRDVMLFGQRTPAAQVQRQCMVNDALLIEGLERSGTSELEDEPERVFEAAASLRTGNSRTTLTGATLIRTSGSTGSARWIRHRAAAHVASAHAVARRLALDTNDRWGWCLPSNHVGGLSILWRSALAGAATIAMPRGVSLGSWLSSIPEDFSPTILSLVPTQLHDLLAEPHSFAALPRTVIVGGAALAPSLLSRAISAGWPIRTTYGMTETASMVTLSDVWSESGQEVHVGTALSHAALSTRSDRLFVKTASLGESLAGPDGWMPTSDRGTLRGDAQWIVEGRLDRVIISGGENLDPSRIESAILALADKKDVLGKSIKANVLDIVGVRVVGTPDDRYGERPVAFIEGSTPMPDQAWFLQALASSLASFEIPDLFLPMPAAEEGEAKPSNARLVQVAIASRKASGF